MLNPILYQALKRRFGNVHIGNAEQPAVGLMVANNQGKMINVPKYGETYSVNCPYCMDGRQRLQFSYLWGVDSTGFDIGPKQLVYCFNTSNRCFDDQPSRLVDLQFSVLGPINYKGVTRESLHEPEVREIPAETEIPGTIIPLHELALDHPACAYMADRGFDPWEYSHSHGVGYCDVATYKYSTMGGRLYIPVTFENKLAGWQGRFSAPASFNLKAMRIPKYYTYKYMRPNVMYNFDVANTYSVIIACEGVTKAWRIGPQSFAYFGSRFGIARAQHIAQDFDSKRWLVFMPDGKEWQQNGDIGPTAPGVIALLRQHLPADRIVPVQLEPDADPGDMDTDILRKLIELQLHRAGWRGDLDATRGVFDYLPSRRYVT